MLPCKCERPSAPRQRCTGTSKVLTSIVAVVLELPFRLVRTQPPSVNLGGKDDQQHHQQKRLLMMRNFPSAWQKWNIMKLWSPVWVDVQPIDSTTCWLVTRTDEDARSLLTIYEMMPSKTFEWVHLTSICERVVLDVIVS